MDRYLHMTPFGPELLEEEVRIPVDPTLNVRLSVFLLQAPDGTCWVRSKGQRPGGEWSRKEPDPFPNRRAALEAAVDFLRNDPGRGGSPQARERVTRQLDLFRASLDRRPEPPPATAPPPPAERRPASTARPPQPESPAAIRPRRTLAVLRPSADGDDEEEQRQAVSAYVRQNGLFVDAFASVAFPSRRIGRTSGLGTLLRRLAPGDRLLVGDLSRLGRNAGDAAVLVDLLAARGVVLIVVRENLVFDGADPDLRDAPASVLFRRLAEIECAYRDARSRSIRAAVKASGSRRGRRKGCLGKSVLDGREEEIRRFLALGVSKTSLARIVGVSFCALNNFIKGRKLAPPPPPAPAGW